MSPHSRRANRNTKAEPGFVKRRNRISGQFSAKLIEMLESPAWRVLTLSGRRVIDRIEIELGHHGGNNNGSLVVTFEDFVAYGIDRGCVAPAIREAEALGFIRAKHGRGGNAEYRLPSRFFLTFAHCRTSKSDPPTHDWRKIKTIEQAAATAQVARAAKDEAAVSAGRRNAAKNKSRCGKTSPKPVRKTHTERSEFPVWKNHTTGQVGKPTLLSRSGYGGSPSAVSTNMDGTSASTHPPETAAAAEAKGKLPWSTPTVTEVDFASLPAELRMLALGLSQHARHPKRDTRKRYGTA